MQFEISSKNNLYIFLCLLLISDITVLLDLPIIRQIIVFFLITVLPGLLILRLLKLTQLNRFEILLLSIGLSIFFLMFVGAFINMLSLSTGISNPLSLYPLLFVINISLLILFSFCYKLNMLSFQISCDESKIWKAIAPFLFLLHIPLIGILGALIVEYYTNSIFSLLLIFYIVVTIFFVTYKRFIPSNLYPVSVFMISFALLLNRTLTTPYLHGSDIHYEYYYAQLATNSFWDSSIYDNVNAMLSVTILPNIYSTLLNMSLIYVYKIIYNFIFSFVPLGLYEIYRLQVGDRDAFLSVFFAMSFYAFLYMTGLPRQQIAELYIVLLMMILITKNISSMKKTILFIVFMGSLIVSHYGTTYIFLFYLVFVSISLILIRESDKITSPTMVMLSCIMALSWYIYISSSSAFSSIVSIADHICSAVFNEMLSGSGFDPDIAKGFGIGITDLKFLHAVGNVWGIATEIIVFIGLFYSLYKYREMKFNANYLLFSLISMFFLLMSVVLPYFASSLAMCRIYQIALLFLSPFCVIGVEFILMTISSSIKDREGFLKFGSIKYAVLMALLIPYFLFNNGFIYEVIEKPQSYDFTFSPADMNKEYNSSWSYFIVDSIPTQDITACNWISDKIDSNTIYVDERRKCEIVGYGMIQKYAELTPIISKNHVIYLGYNNVMEGTAYYLDPQKVLSEIKYNISDISPSLDTRNKIYTNNGSVFYF